MIEQQLPTRQADLSAYADAAGELWKDEEAPEPKENMKLAAGGYSADGYVKDNPQYFDGPAKPQQDPVSRATPTGKSDNQLRQEANRKKIDPEEGAKQLYELWSNGSMKGQPPSEIRAAARRANGLRP